MAFLQRFLQFLVFSSCLKSSLATLDLWQAVTDLQSNLEVLRAVQGQSVADLSRRDPQFGNFGPGRPPFGNEGFPRPPAPVAPDDFSELLSSLIDNLGNSLEALVLFLRSQFNISPSTTSLQSSASPSTGGQTNPALTYTTPGATTHHDSTSTVTSSLGVTVSESSTTVVSSTTATTSPAAATYSFNPAARNLNAVYFGQTTSPVSLTTVCADDSVDIIIIGFITGFFDDADEVNITMNQGAHCWAPNQQQQDARALGLKDCVGDGFAAEIKACQLRGKKVFISAGGYYSNLTIPSEQAAEYLAQRLWELFLGGNDPEIAPLRPYGDVVLDGFDFDNEKPANKPFIPILATSLRQYLASDPTKPYFLSAAPQCPLPDASIPVPELLNVIDFFGVQFYNNPSCQLSAGPGFFTSLKNWSDTLLGLTVSGTGSSRRTLGKRGRLTSSVAEKKGSAHKRDEVEFQQINNGIFGPQLLIGTPAFDWATAPDQNTGYVDVAAYKAILEQVKDMDLPNLAGAMFWDGGFQSTSAQDVDGAHLTYAEVVRDVL